MKEGRKGNAGRRRQVKEGNGRYRTKGRKDVKEGRTSRKEERQGRK
jgi:hypothetical protein